VMGTVEVFNRPPPRVAPPASTTVVLGPAWDPQRGMLSGATYPPLPAPQGVEAGPMAALAAPLRILEQAEAAALIAASTGATRFACVAGLMGLTPAEALAVEAADVQADPPSLTVRGPWSRTLPAPPWLALTLGVGESPASVVLHDATGRPLTEADVESLLIGVALDAAIDRGATLGWDSLRNTCIDWLVGQGLRYADLPRFVGRVDAGLLQALSARHVEVARRESDRVEVLMPALRLEP
jgi:polysaccharide biosynthesis transport protein